MIKCGLDTYHTLPMENDDDDNIQCKVHDSWYLDYVIYNNDDGVF